MSDKVKCKTHGVQDATYVCQHILESMHAGTPVGFHWPETSESARPDAWCHACEEARRQGNGEWTEELMEFVNIRLLCGACYDYAKDIAFRGHKLNQ
jgi:hypothetical protein